MVTSSLISSSFLLPTKPLTIQRQNQHHHNTTSLRNRAPFKVQAAKLPTGVLSRACMIGIIGVFIVELIINKGVLQTIGVDGGKGSIFLCNDSVQEDKQVSLV